MIKSEKIVEELILGKILVSEEKAISALSSITSHLTLIEYADLLAYNKGWVWVFYFSDQGGQNISHIAFVHAEGKPLIKELAQEIISTDRDNNKIFEGLIPLNISQADNVTEKDLLDTSKKYFNYLENELGEIQFEGLPTDKEAGTVKVKLENIFVPLHLTPNKSQKKKDEFEFTERESIGQILSNNSKLAILAKPGGGKSTLIKRIAIAYAFPERRKEINDKLPEKSWFPIFLRCRELGEKVTLSITEIINGIL